MTIPIGVTPGQQAVKFPRDMKANENNKVGPVPTSLDKVCQSVDKLRLVAGLRLLQDDKVKAFKDALQKKADKYNCKASDIDVYWETLIDMNSLPDIRKELLHWHKYLDNLPDSQFIQGAKATLTVLADLCSEINELEPLEHIKSNQQS